jgi:imidazolonepropionase-like amidohydrolase
LKGFYEMRRRIAAGASTRQLLRAATIENARAMRIEREIGSVETGKRANLLLLRANPLDTVEAYNAIDSVILGGRFIPRPRLSVLP